jgi:simple sugar transport system permease protein
MSDGDAIASTGDLAKPRFPGPRRGRLATDLLSEHGGLLAALAALVAGSVIFAPHFASIANLLDILRQMAFTGIIGLGMTLVIIAGEIDISVGSAVAFTSALFGVVAVNLGWPFPVATGTVLAVATLIGLSAGVVRAFFGVPSFIVTLALFSALKGGALLLTDAIPIPILDDNFNWWGTGAFLGVPVPALILFILFAVFSVIANRTSFGRSVYTIGGNAEAAYLSGVPVAAVRTILFGLTGFLAGVSGLLQTSRLAAGNAGMGVGLEFAVITAVIVGGASLFGGKGSMLGTMLGGLFIAVLNNAMVLFGVNSYAQYVANGLVVLLAVLISTLRSQGGSAPGVLSSLKRRR